MDIILENNRRFGNKELRTTAYIPENEYYETINIKINILFAFHIRLGVFLKK